MLNHNIKEEKLKPAIIKFFKGKGFTSVYDEVSFYNKRIDLILYNSKRREMIGIEIKIKDWKKAIIQAITDQLALTKVYIAIWHTHIPLKHKDIFINLGVGLIEVNKECKIVVQPKRANQYSIYNSRKIMKEIKNKKEKK